jgi:TonB family protein
MGVLEVFSPRPYAFADEDMAALRELAELAETARARTFTSPAAPVPNNPEPLTSITGPRFSEVLSAKTEAVLELLHPHNRVLWISSAVVTMLLAVTVVGWKVWRTSAAGTASVQASAPVTSNQNAATQTVIDWHPAPPKPSAGKSAIQNASEIQREQVIRRVASGPATQTSTDSQIPAPDQTPSGATVAGEDTSVPPEAPLVAANLGEKALGGVLAGSAPMPKFGTPVSQGVTGGVLIHKVAPAYPVQAVPLRLAGDVVLQAIIAENGSVQDLKVVRGHPMLTTAALDAVRQWRYSPYELNGKPVAMKTTITINFKTSSR